MTTLRYPLIDSSVGELRAASGRALREIDLDAVLRGDLSPADLQVSADTLRQQAEIARLAGFEQLAENLLRAAELTAVPNEDLLQMYDKLRPGRATYDELLHLAETLAVAYAAVQTATFVREAAEVYRVRKLTKAG